MFNWFKKKNKQKEMDAPPPQKVVITPFVIHPKETLAWIAAMEGNNELLGWLKFNRPEIYHCIQAIFLEDESRKWLMDNNYLQLYALISAAEGDVKAQSWLKQFRFLEFYHMAMAIEDEKESWPWLRSNSTEDIYLLTKSIKKIKDAIEQNHNSIHSINKDR